MFSKSGTRLPDHTILLMDRYYRRIPYISRAAYSKVEMRINGLSNGSYGTQVLDFGWMAVAYSGMQLIYGILLVRH